MKVLYVCLDPGIPVGSAKGASVHVCEMIRALAQEGHETALIAREVVATPVAPSLVTELGPPPHGRRLPLIGAAVMRYDDRRVRRAVSAALRRFGPDLVYERYALGRSAVGSIARRHGARRLLEVNAPLVAERALVAGRNPSAAATAAEQATWRSADLVVVPSHPLADLVRSAGQRNVVVAPNAVDPDLFTPTTGSSTALRERLGLTDRLVVGFAGSARIWHDLPTLVAAVAMLPARMRAALLVIGASPPEDVVSDATRRGVVLIATGPLPHQAVPAHLGCVDVAVASLRPDPNLSYFSPLKALEYLASGCPTVVADVGDLRALAECGVAMSYRAGEAASLAAAVTRVASDASLQQRLREAGRAYALTRTWRNVAAMVVRARNDSIARTDEPVSTS
ncbi:MAG: glycosyltransferase [Actinomycetes bacterium]